MKITIKKCYQKDELKRNKKEEQNDREAQILNEFMEKQ